MRNSRITLAALGLALGAAASAQSFNVDLNMPAGFGAGAPASTYGAAAGQPGAWNSVTPTSPGVVGLVGLNGAATGATLTRATNGFFANKNHPNTTGDADKLLDDVQTAQANESLAYTFGNLAAGTYIVYTYAGEYTYGWNSQVTIAVADGDWIQTAEGAGDDNLMPGVAYTAHGKAVAAGGSITVVVSNTTSNADCYVSGFQLRRLDPLGRARIYVDTNAAGPSQDGATWAGAYVSPQSALDIASRAGAKNFEIWTANGFYYPTLGTTRTATFVVPSALHFFGGFNGNETTLAQRGDPRSHPTYLSGGIGGASNTDNSFTVLDASNTTGATIIDGFFITSGYGNQVQSNSGDGGGVKMINGSAVFNHCNIIHNTATHAGAGVFSSGGAPTFTDCIFYANDNSNGEGGAVHHANSIYIIDLWNCQFLGNYAAGPGAGVELLNTTGRMVNCLFSGNSTGFGGGGLYVSGASANAIVLNSTFSGNASSTVAGGIQCRSGANLNLNNSIVWGNDDQFSPGVETRNLSIEGIASGTTYTMQYSTVGGLSAYSGVGCNATDPQFVNAAGADNNPGNFDDDCRLKTTSALINAGSVSLLLNDYFDLDDDGLFNEQLPIDLAGNPRRLAAAGHATPGVGPAPFVDRGAFEFVPSCPGDTNGDFIVNFVDLNNVLSDYGQSGANLPGDVNGDGAVDFRDLNIVLSAFGNAC